MQHKINLPGESGGSHIIEGDQQIDHQILSPPTSASIPSISWKTKVMMHPLKELCTLLLCFIAVSARFPVNGTEVFFNTAKRSPYLDISGQEDLVCNVRDFSVVGDGVTDDTG